MFKVECSIDGKRGGVGGHKRGVGGHKRQGVRQGNRKTEFVSGILIRVSPLKRVGKRAGAKEEEGSQPCRLLLEGTPRVLVHQSREKET